ncbi:MAG: universal stress protein [Armatimonadota bacterium]
MHLLLGTDGSPGAVDAARFIAALPLPPETRVTVVAVVPRGANRAGEAELAPVEEVLAGSPVRLVREVREGIPAEELLKAEELLEPDLLVLGSAGRSAVARFWIGSVAERVAEYSRGPVLITWPGRVEIRRVLVAVDRTPLAEAMMRWLRRFPLPARAELHLGTVVTLLDLFARWKRTLLPPTRPFLRILERQACHDARRHLQALTSDFRTAAPIQTHVRLGDPSEELLQLAEELSADLLVIGSRGFGLLGALLLGSVSDHLLARQPCSLLILKPRPPGEGRPE